MKEEKERKKEKKRARVGRTHNSKAMVADCSDNGLSSSVGLRGRRGGTSLWGFTSQHLPCGLRE